jgi:hypothetical protein
MKLQKNGRNISAGEIQSVDLALESLRSPEKFPLKAK